jgi:hypothetical protein
MYLEHWGDATTSGDHPERPNLAGFVIEPALKSIETHTQKNQFNCSNKLIILLAAILIFFMANCLRT